MSRPVTGPSSDRRARCSAQITPYSAQVVIRILGGYRPAGLRASPCGRGSGHLPGMSDRIRVDDDDYQLCQKGRKERLEGRLWKRNGADHPEDTCRDHAIPAGALGSTPYLLTCVSPRKTHADECIAPRYLREVVADEDHRYRDDQSEEKRESSLRDESERTGYRECVYREHRCDDGDDDDVVRWTSSVVVRFAVVIPDEKRSIVTRYEAHDEPRGQHHHWKKKCALDPAAKMIRRSGNSPMRRDDRRQMRKCHDRNRERRNDH